MKLRAAQIFVLLMISLSLLVPAVAFADTETASDAQTDFENIGLVPDGKVNVGEPDASPTTTVKPPVTSSTKILRDGTVINTATTATTAVKKPQPATTGTTVRTPVQNGAAVTTQPSGTATTDEDATVVVKGEKVTNPATTTKEKLPLTGMDLKPYFAIAILLIIAGRATYTRAAPRP